MTPEERRLMRDRIAAALRTALLPGATALSPGAYRRVDLPPDDLLARFTAELTGLGGEVHDMPDASATAIAALVASIVTGIADDGQRRALAWDDAHIPVDGMRAALEASGFEVVHLETGHAESAGRAGTRPAPTAIEAVGAGLVPALTAGNPAARSLLASCVVGITGVDALLAETGSMALAAGPGRGRLASLLPPVHVAIARRAQLMHSLPDLLIEMPDLASAGSNFVCITGPSRTADIEHTLSRGVHGPGVVHVIVI